MNCERKFKGVWIPKEIWLNKELTPMEKLYIVEIDSLDDEETGCFASNKHFETIFGQNSANVSRTIGNLKEKGWIEIEYERKGKEIIKRTIRIKRPPYPNRYYQNDNRVLSKRYEGYYQNDKESNTYLSNTIENNKYIVEQIILYLNGKADKHYKSTTPKTIREINALLKEGFTINDFKVVIDTKCDEWLNDKKMNQYLRPDTLFGTKFESYLNQKQRVKTTRDINIDIKDF